MEGDHGGNITKKIQMTGKCGQMVKNPPAMWENWV